jgi:hypothetical protein
LDQEPEFRPYEIDESITTGSFDVAFGIKQNLDPSIGYYAVNEVHFQFNGTDNKGMPVRIKTKRKL